MAASVKKKPTHKGQGNTGAKIHFCTTCPAKSKPEISYRSYFLGLYPARSVKVTFLAKVCVISQLSKIEEDFANVIQKSVKKVITVLN
jgi:hypothetical protein